MDNLTIKPDTQTKIPAAKTNKYLQSNDKKQNSEEKVKFKDRKFSSKEVCSIAAASALAAAVIGGQLLSGRARSITRTTKLKNFNLQRSLNIEKGKVTELTNTNNAITETNKGLNKEIQKLGEKLKDLIEGDLSPKEIRDNIYKTLKAKINGGKLDYDILKPPIVGKGNFKVPDDALDLPVYNKTGYRADMIPLNIPQLASNGSFEYTVPRTSQIKVTHMPSKDFSPVLNAQTAVTESYADSVRWNADKIARDILQNFYDGHGQTLDGVRFSFTPNGKKVKVRISGDSTYTVDKAVYIGETTKRGNARAAGNYGEGLKMCALKLLKDYDIGKMNIASDNWKLTYSLQNGSLTDKRVLSYSLEKADKYNGNYVEFETDNKELLKSLRGAINKFYNSGNEHFKCPDFENDVLGIKILKPNEIGGVYIAGQRFEYENSYNGLEGMAIFFKEKPDSRFLDVSRDRTSLDQYSLQSLGSWCTTRFPKEESLKILSALKQCWRRKSPLDEEPIDSFIKGFLNGLNFDKVHVKFPDNYVAFSPASNDVVIDLIRAGYTVCKDEFASLGMKTIKDLMGEARTHEPVVPNSVQAEKIKILKEAIANLSSSLEGKHFTPEELNTRIYLFDKNAAKENKMYDDTLAEAIIDNGVSKGFWIDKSYLDRASLSDVLETALHELSHKSGGDETAEFSYKLTNVNRDAIAQILNDVDSREKLNALSKLWADLI